MSASRQSKSAQGSRRIMLPKRRVNSSKSATASITTRASNVSYQSPYFSYNEPPVIGRFVNLSCTRSVTSTQLDGIVERLTRPTVSSRGGVDLLDKDYDYNKPRPRKTLIVIPGLERRYMGLQKALSSTQLDGIVGRITRPTVASRGGVDLLDKDYDYNKPRPRKTLIVIPGLERRYMGLQKVNRKQMEQIVARLTRMTTAYDAKFGPCHNGWVDETPKRGMYS